MLSLNYSRFQLWITVDKLINTTIESRTIKYSYVLLLLILTFPYFEFAAIPTAGIDNSWRIALELIQEKQLIWGKDIIYTYGPLGRWLQRYAITTDRVELLFIDLFTAFNLALLFYSLLPKPLRLWHLFLYFFVWAVINGMYGEWLHFMWFYWVIYGGIYYLYKPHKALPFYLVFIGTINFFMKANFGLIALAFIVSLLIYSWYAKQVKGKECLAYFAALLFFLFAGAYWLHTDLVNYCRSGFHIISGYNESQAFYPDYRLRWVASSYGCYGLYTLSAITYIGKLVRQNQRLIKPQYNTIFALVWFLIICFVLLKYAFTRADDGHITSFIKLSSLMLVLMAVTVEAYWIRKVFFCYLLMNLVVYLFMYTPLFGPVPTNYTTAFSSKLYSINAYFQQAFTQTYPTPKATIPALIRQQIGHQTVDVVPHELSDIYFNQFNYNPRPVIQSYQAYNWYLDSINREKYLSPTAPDWIIYSYESIDGKYPLADETQTLLAILQQYSVANRTPTRLFLRKNNRMKKLRMIAECNKLLQMGQKLPVPYVDSVLYVIHAKPHYNLYGQALKFFFQPPQLSMTLRAENGTERTYRTVPILLEKGVLINARVDNLDDAREFLETHHVSQKRVTDVVFNQKVRWQPGFEPTLDVTIRAYRLQ